MKQMPKIEKFMTPMPHTVGSYVTLKTASNLMKEHRIRHLPVEKAGCLVGVLTDRDVKLASSLNHSEELKVEDVMTADPYTVTPEAPLDHTVYDMAEHRYGCAVVRQQNGKVVGIFTTTDGLRVLGEILNQHYRSDPQ